MAMKVPPSKHLPKNILKSENALHNYFNYRILTTYTFVNIYTVNTLTPCNNHFSKSIQQPSVKIVVP